MDSVEGSTSRANEEDLKCTELVCFNPEDTKPSKAEESIFKEIRKYEPVNNYHLLAKMTPVSISVAKVEGVNGFLPASVAVYRYPQTVIYNDWKDNLVYWTKIGLLPKNIKDYRTTKTGLKAEDLIYYSTSWDEVKEDLRRILKDRIVVGMGLESDLNCLEIQDTVKPENRFEIENKIFDQSKQPIELRDIIYVFTKGEKKILEYEPGYVSAKTNVPVYKSCYMIIIYNWLKADEKKISRDRRFDPHLTSGFPNYQWINDVIDWEISMKKIPKVDDGN